MELVQVILLALVQGLTEFLPISSSAHLILVPRLAGWQDQGLAFDVAVHVGTLGAVVLYFRRELVPMGRDWFVSFATRKLTRDGKLAWAVVLGTIPAGLAGILLNDVVEQNLRSPLVIASTTIVFGLLLWLADRHRKQYRDEHDLTWVDILVIGLAQAIALIPGTSRSGITITAALFAGLSRQAAARYSFLLSIPIIAAAGLLETNKLLQQPVVVDWSAMMLAVVIAGVSAYLVIHYFLTLITRLSLLPFVIYRLILGLFLFFLFI
ncbi:MAG: undecaprenyl-diphosphate phosphatase [Acidiferrobacterales bacterium]